MELKTRISNKCLGLILILCLTKVCHGQLMCYVCDNCAKVSMETPKLECNEDFFNAGGPTSSSIQTTTEHSATTVGVTTEGDTTSMGDTTQTPSTISNEETNSSTTSNNESSSEISTPQSEETPTLEEVERTSSTEEQPPSPPTVGPPKNTTALPTPPTPDTVEPLDDVDNLNNRNAAHNQNVNNDEVETVDLEQSTAEPYSLSAGTRLRQLRSVSNVSFHCYKVKATTANGTMVVNRGCSRVQTNESVCDQWQSKHPLDKITKCYPCSRTKCNGSSTLSVSVTTLFVAIIAIFMRRQ